jgi:hypothetical protein
MNNIKVELTFDQGRALAYQEAKKILTPYPKAAKAGVRP